MRKPESTRVELRSRLRVGELAAAVEREMADLRGQAHLPGQASVLAYLDIARTALDSAHHELRAAEREMSGVGP